MNLGWVWVFEVWILALAFSHSLSPLSLFIFWQHPAVLRDYSSAINCLGIVHGSAQGTMWYWDQTFELSTLSLLCALSLSLLSVKEIKLPLDSRTWFKWFFSPILWLFFECNLWNLWNECLLGSLLHLSDKKLSLMMDLLNTFSFWINFKTFLSVQVCGSLT